MKTTTTSLSIIALLALLCCTPKTVAASWTAGYVTTSDPNPLTNGTDSVLLINSAITGGGDSTLSLVGEPGFSVQMTNLWTVGQTVTLTGIAMVQRPQTTNGTFTIDFYDLDGGANANAFDGFTNETKVGSAQVVLTTDIITVGLYYATFDTPITFTAASTGVAIHWNNSAAIRCKIREAGSAPGVVRVNNNTGVPIGGTYANFGLSLAGKAVTPAAPLDRVWRGNLSAVWDTTSANWTNTLNGSNTYSDGTQVILNDALNPASLNTNITLSGTHAPLSVTANNSSYDYILSGGGLSGSMTLSKLGAGALTLNMANDYSGGSTLSAGVVRLGNAAGLGTGPITFNGGRLSSVGAADVTVTNALTFSGSGAFGDVANNGTVTLSGPVDFTGGARDIAVISSVVFTGSTSNGGLDEKSGTGTLTFAGVTGDVTNGQWQIEGGDFVISGGNITKSGGGIRIGNTNANDVSRMVITNGAQVFMKGAGLNIRVGNNQAPTASATSTNILDISGTLAWTTNNGGAVFMGSAGAFAQINLLPGGLLKVANFIQGTAVTELNLLGGTLGASADGANYLSNLTAVNISTAAGVTIDTDTNNIAIAQPLADPLVSGGGLTKVGMGTLRLNGVNSYSGTTLVSAGTLGGIGTIAGPLSVAGGGTLSPGDNAIGTLTVNNNVTLGGNVLIEVNTSQAPSSDSVAVSGTLSYGGSITVTNEGPALTIGDSFAVFPAGGTGNVTVLGDAGSGQAFSLDKATGVISVVASLPSPTPLNYTNLGAGVVQFSWTGAFKLQWQTNAASVGLNSSWVDYPDSSNPVNVTNNPAVPTTFFRLINQ